MKAKRRIASEMDAAQPQSISGAASSRSEAKAKALADYEAVYAQLPGMDREAVQARIKTLVAILDAGDGSHDLRGTNNAG